LDVQLDLLGGFALSVGGERVQLPPASQRVLAFLAIEQRPLRRRHVAQTLWPDAVEARQRGNLRSALWRLRSTGHPLVHSSTAEAWLAAGVAVDLYRLRVALDHVFQEGSGPPLLDHSLLTTPLLPDWNAEPWLNQEREHLRQLSIEALERLCEQKMHEGSLDLALQAGLAAVRRDPARESANRLLIAAYAKGGNYGEALQQYKRFRRHRHDVGVAESPLLRKTIDGIPLRS